MKCLKKTERYWEDNSCKGHSGKADSQSACEECYKYMHDKALAFHIAIWQNIIFHMMYGTWIILRGGAGTNSVNKLGDKVLFHDFIPIFKQEK